MATATLQPALDPAALLGEPLLGEPLLGELRVTLRPAIVFALLVGITAGGCPNKGEGETTLPIVTTDNPAAEAAVREAQAAADEGRVEDAEARFRDFLQSFPDDPLRPVARLGLGRVLLAKGEVPEARAEFARVRDHEEPALAERARLYEAVAMHLQGESEAAIEQLLPLMERTVDPAETALLYQTLAAAAERLGRRAEAVTAYDALVRSDVTATAKDEARTRLDELIAGLDAAEIDALFGSLPREGYAWPSVGRRALREAFVRGDLPRVRTVATALEEQRVPLDRELQSIALRAERTGRTDLGAIGAILPLTGRGREVGQLALQSLMLAAGLPPDRPPGEETPRVFFRDSGGDPDRAARAVDDLVTLHQVVAIVGPVDARSSRAAARRAQELGVPILTLSPDRRIVEEGDHVFRLFASPEDEAEALVARAIEGGARRFVALRPDHGYGATMSQAFEAAVALQDAEWAGEVRYAPGTTSFGETLEQLASKRFDAIVVPDHSRQLALIAPSLAAAGWWSQGGTTAAEVPEGARPVRLLVPSVGLDDQLVRSTGRYLQGALFAQAYHAPTATGIGRQLADAFQQRYRRAPDAYGAAAFDAFHLVRAAVASGATSRTEVARRLAAGTDAETAGASGGFDGRRQPRRGTRVLMLDGATLVPTGP